MWSDLPILDRLQACWDPITETQIVALEAAIGLRFPDDYRQFLLTFNAGVWRHLVKCVAEHPHWITVEPLIVTCFGIVSHPRYRYDDIQRTKLEVLDEYLPPTLVPIMDSMGDPICIHLDEEAPGSIYLWNKTEYGTDIDPVHWIADSFTEFLESLVPFNYDAPLRESLPVFQAAELGSLDEVQSYLADGGKVDIRNERGRTLLMCATNNSWPKIVRLLLEAGANPHARDAEGWNLLHHAVNGNSLDSLKMLISAGVDVTYRDAQGRSLAEIAHDELHHRIGHYLEPPPGC